MFTPRIVRITPRQSQFITLTTPFAAQDRHTDTGFIGRTLSALLLQAIAGRDSVEEVVNPGSFVLAAVLAFNGPFFPASLLQSVPRADGRRCSIGAQATQSDCALIGAQWVVTTAGAVATARPVAGRLHVRIGDDCYTVEQLVYHPKWNGGVKYDVTLLKLTEHVRAFPLLPPPGEFPVSGARVAQHALAQREWVAQTIGPSPLWDDPGTALVSKQSALVTRVRSLMDVWAGRSTND